MEQRKLARYRLEVPVTFSWEDQQGMRQQSEGSTRDISSVGIFVQSATCPPVGAPIWLEVFFPALGESALAFRMQAEGQVLRVEPTAPGIGSGGFAAASERFVLQALGN